MRYELLVREGDRFFSLRWVQFLIAASILLGALAYAMYPLFQGLIVNEDDIRLTWLPAFKFYSDALQQGRSIVLTPGIFSGFPLALGQIGGFFDPINMFLFKLLPFLEAYHTRVFLDYFLTGIFTYALCRALRLSFFSSSIALFSIITAHHIIEGGSVMRANSMYMLPTLFFVLTMLHRHSSEDGWYKTVFYMVLGSATVIIGFIGGYTQHVLYALCATGFYALFLLYTRFSWRYVAVLGGMGVASVIILAPYIRSVLDFVSTSYRAGGLDWLSASDTVSLLQYVNILGTHLFLPPYGVGATQALYIGSLSVFFFLYSFVTLRTNRLSVFFWGLFAFATLSAFPYPLFYLMHQLPAFDLFRFPIQWFLVSSFCMSILAAIGFEALYTAYRSRLTAVSARALSMAVLVLVAANFLFFTRSTIAHQSVPAASFLEEPWVVQTIVSAESTNREAYRATPLYPGDTQWSVFAKDTPRTPVEQVAFNREYVQSHFTPLLWGVESIRGVDYLEPRRYMRVISFLDQESLSEVTTQKGTLLLPSTTLPLLSMMNVKYFWSIVPLDPIFTKTGAVSQVAEGTLAEGTLPLFLYENKTVVPRVHAPASITVLLENEDTFDSIIMREHDFNREGFIECDVCEKGTVTYQDPVDVRMIATDTNRMRFETTAKTDRWIILSNSMIIGWVATIDGVRAPIRYANYIYQGIYVPAGTHTVEIVFPSPYASHL